MNTKDLLQKVYVWKLFDQRIVDSGGGEESTGRFRPVITNLWEENDQIFVISGLANIMLYHSIRFNRCNRAITIWI